MTLCRVLLILSATAASGCAQPGRDGMRLVADPVAAAASNSGDQPVSRYLRVSPSGSPAMIRAMDLAAQQVRRCYRGPRVASSGRQIVTRVRVRINPEGAIAGVPAVIAQDGVNATNQAYATRMAEAAIEAVLRCAPLRLPAEAHGGVALTIDLTFSPLSSV